MAQAHNIRYIKTNLETHSSSPTVIMTVIR